jgi:hypothetical protein
MLIDLKQNAPDDWECSRDGFDFHITIDGAGRYVVDVFDSSIEDADDAHLASIECATLDEARAICAEWTA